MRNIVKMNFSHALNYKYTYEVQPHCFKENCFFALIFGAAFTNLCSEYEKRYPQKK